MSQSKNETRSEVSQKSTESGSTIIGAISLLLSFFFLYIGIQRVWWSFTIEAREYLVFGLVYVLIGVIAVGGAVYGLTTKKQGARVTVIGLMITGAGLFALSSYYWFTGMVMDGTVYDVYNALTFTVFGIVFFVIGAIVGRFFERRGIDYSISDGDPDETAERIEQRGDEMAESIEQFGDNFNESVAGSTERILSGIPWSKVVLLGVLLWFAFFAVADYETLLVIVMVLAWLTIPVAVYFDSKPIRKSTKGRTWWWVFVLGSLVPLFAVIPGLGWLLWKRRLA